MKIYQVGGSIRDEYLGITSKDRDWVVVGSSPETMIAAGYKPVGEDFPVFLHPETAEEYALARTEKKIAHGYKGFEFYCSPDVTLEEDLMRRDLTVNAIARDHEGNIYDPFNGIEDLNNKVLRHTSEAFIEDPLRALRLARFKSHEKMCDFSIHTTTESLLQSFADTNELAYLSAERVWQEFIKALSSPKSNNFLKFIWEYNLQSPWFEDLSFNKHNESADPFVKWFELNALNNFSEITALQIPNKFQQIVDVGKNLLAIVTSTNDDKLVSNINVLNIPRNFSIIELLLTSNIFDSDRDYLIKLKDNIMQQDFSALANIKHDELEAKKKDLVLQAIKGIK